MFFETWKNGGVVGTLKRPNIENPRLRVCRPTLDFGGKKSTTRAALRKKCVRPYAVLPDTLTSVSQRSRATAELPH